jgi:hypothetical protein
MKLGKLIRTGGLALALAAGTLAGGCDDDDPVTGKDGSVTTDGGSDAGKIDTGTTPDAGTVEVTPPASDADSSDSTPADGGDEPGSDGSAD